MAMQVERGSLTEAEWVAEGERPQLQALLEAMDRPAAPEPVYTIYYGWEDDEGGLHWLEEPEVDDAPLRRPLGRLEVRCVETALGRMLFVGCRVHPETVAEACQERRVDEPDVRRATAEC